jgi:hypothetical protein
MAVRFVATTLVGSLRAIVVLGLLSACDKGESGSVTISGDVAGLDTIGLRGEALIANAGKLPSAEDSLRAVVDGKVTRPHGKSSANTTTPALPGVNPMSLRAQARGDSMARAAAMKLVSGNGATGSGRGDTLRGVVTVIGADATKQVVLRTAQGANISLSGMVTTGLARLAGAGIVVRGIKVSPRDVVVSNGVPAFDGKLEGAADTGWWLQLTDGSGKKRLGALPSPLQGLEGTRVWIAFKQGTGSALTYGVIGRR